MHRCIYYFGLWEPLLTRWIHDTLQPGDTFIDVGANIGYFSVLAAKRVGKSGSVVAIEPSPSTFAELETNIALNRLTNISTVRAAASRTQRTVPFYRAYNDAESSTVAVPGSVYDTEVPAAPLPELVSDEELARARLIKIDVEGAELDVVAGLVPAIMRLRSDAEFAIEVHPHLLALVEGSVQELLALFEDLGFSAYYLPVDFSPVAHLDPPAAARPMPLTAPKEELVHLVLSRRRTSEL